jgi:hypothetical protein
VCARHPLVQYIEEIPEVRPLVTKLTTEEGWCAHCQQEVYSTHPLQTGRAGGAAAAQPPLWAPATVRVAVLDCPIKGGTFNASQKSLLRTAVFPKVAPDRTAFNNP